VGRYSISALAFALGLSVESAILLLLCLDMPFVLSGSSGLESKVRLILHLIPLSLSRELDTLTGAEWFLQERYEDGDV
jgi:hypothetical protein